MCDTWSASTGGGGGGGGGAAAAGGGGAAEAAAEEKKEEKEEEAEESDEVCSPLIHVLRMSVYPEQAPCYVTVSLCWSCCNERLPTAMGWIGLCRGELVVEVS